MKRRTQEILFSLILALVFTACQQDQKKTQTAEEQKAEMRRDSAALHVAIYPSEACLPFYYAEATGIYRQMGVDIRFSHLNAMESCDTALVNHRVEVAVSDLARLLVMKKHQSSPVAIATLSNHLNLLTAKGKRIKEVKGLKEHIIALERHSETDYWSDELTEKAGLEELDVFRTQFNEHKTREEMLSNVLLDAAFLDQPYSSFTQINGSKRLWSRGEDMDSWNVLSLNAETMKDSTRVRQIRLLLQGYNAAVEILNKGERKEVSDSLLVHAYHFPQAAVDTITTLQASTIRFKALKPTNQQTLETARQWMIKRGQISTTLETADMINGTLVPSQKNNNQQTQLKNAP